MYEYTVGLSTAQLLPKHTVRKKNKFPKSFKFAQNHTQEVLTLPQHLLFFHVYFQRMEINGQ